MQKQLLVVAFDEEMPRGTYFFLLALRCRFLERFLFPTAEQYAGLFLLDDLRLVDFIVILTPYSCSKTCRSNARMDMVRRKTKGSKDH